MDDISFASARRSLAFDALYRPRPAKHAVPDRESLYDHATTMIGEREPLTYLTFGVSEGAGLHKMTRAFTHPDSVFVGFDSIADHGPPPDIDDRRVKFVQGWFQNTLHRSLTWLQPLLSDHVLVRCDTQSYASVLFLLTSLWPHCRAWYLLMEDVTSDSLIALHDFSLAYPVRIEFQAQYGGDVPRAVLGRLTRVEFEPPAIEESPTDILARADKLANDGHIVDATELWARLRRSHPQLTDAWMSAAMCLHVHGRIDEARALLDSGNFLSDAGSVIGWADLTRNQRDWPKAARRYEFARALFPDHIDCWIGNARSLREMGRLEEAEALLLQARQLAPDAAESYIQFAWIAHIRRDWPESLQRWGIVADRFPDQADAAVGGGIALREMGRLEEAEARLAAARDRFPHHAGTATEHGWVAIIRRDWTEALRRWAYVRERFPGEPAGCVGASMALRELGRPDEAETIIAGARQSFPDDAGAAIEYALLSVARERWPETLRRCADIRAVARGHPAGYFWGIHALRALHRLTDAETLLREACVMVPHDASFAVDLARSIEDRGDASAAELAWNDAMARFPDQPEVIAAAATAWRGRGNVPEAEQLIEAALFRAPHQAVLAEQNVLNGVAGEDWPLAPGRLEDASGRFPASSVIRERLHQVWARIAGSVDAPDQLPLIAGSDADRELVGNFESLGGCGGGTAFGAFQRVMGGEAPGLLRCAELDHASLIGALDTEFEGVGDPEFTRVFASPGKHSRYWTIDTRYFMATNTRLNAADIPIDQMSDLVHQRTRFLRAGLIDDLRAGGKIFAHVSGTRPLTEEQLKTLLGSIRRYGDNTLFCLCCRDTTHPVQLVERRGDGVLTGYFVDGPNESLSAQFLTLCRQAYALWTA